LFVENNLFFRNKKYFSLEKNIIVNKHKYIQYLILGKPIYDVTKHLFNKMPIIINLPSFFNTKYLIKDNFNQIIVGQIGGGSKEKGTQYLFQIAKQMKKEIERNKIKFILVGRLDNNLLSLDEGLVEYHTEVIGQEKFEIAIKELHFALQLRDNMTSQATANATFLDSLEYNKPFFSLENNFMTYYVKDVKLRDCMFSTINDIIDYLKWFIALDEESKIKKYNSLVNDIQKLKNPFSIQYNAELLSSQINNIETIV